MELMDVASILFVSVKSLFDYYIREKKTSIYKSINSDLR